MTDNSSSVEIVKLQFETDQASLARSRKAFRDLQGDGKQLVESQANAQRVTVRGSQTVVRALEDEAAAYRGVAKEATYSGQQVARVSKDQIDALNAETKALEREAQAYKNVNRARLPVEGGIPAAGPSTGNLGRVGTGLASVAAVLPGGAGDAARTAGQLVQVLDDLPRAAAEARAAIAAVGASLGPIAVAGAVAAGVFLLIKSNLDEAKKAAERAIESEKELIRLRVEGNKDEIEAKLEAANLQRRILAEQIANSERNLQKFAGANGKVPSSYGEFKAAGLTTADISAIKANRDEIAGLTAEYDKVTKEAQVYNDALRSAEIVYRDNMRGQEALAQLTIASIQNETSLRQQAAERAATWTKEQIAAEQDAINRRQEAIKAQIAEINSSSAAGTAAARESIAGLQAELNNLNTAEQLLTSSVRDAVRAREAETDAIKKQLQLADESRSKQADIQKSLDAFNAAELAAEEKLATDRANIAKQGAERILQIEDQLQLSIVQARTDAQRADDAAALKRDAEIAKIVTSAPEQEEAIRAESAERIIAIEERAAAERERILRDYNRDANTAIQNRDAVALDAAMQARDDGLKQAKADFNEGVQQEKAALKERLDAQRTADATRIQELRDNFETEKRERELALSQKLDDLRAAAERERTEAQDATNRALADLKARFDAEEDIRITRFAEQLSAYDAHLKAVKDLTVAKLQEIANNIIKTYDSIIASTSSSASSGVPFGEDSASQTGPPVPNARGGRNLPGGLKKVGEEGTEVLWTPPGSSIFNHRDSMNLLDGLARGGSGGGNKSATVQVILPNVHNVSDMDRWAQTKLPDHLADIFEKLGS